MVEALLEPELDALRNDIMPDLVSERPSLYDLNSLISVAGTVRGNGYLLGRHGDRHRSKCHLTSAQMFPLYLSTVIGWLRLRCWLPWMTARCGCQRRGLRLVLVLLTISLSRPPPHCLFLPSRTGCISPFTVLLHSPFPSLRLLGGHSRANQ